MEDAGWDKDEQIDTLLDFINDEIGAVKDLKRYIRAKFDHQSNEVVRRGDGTEGDVSDRPEP